MTLCLMTCFVVSAQQYYPKLDNIFLEDKEPDEIIFHNDIMYIREGLKKATEKVWMKNLQLSVSRGGGFYSLQLIPKWVYDVDLFDTGVVLKFNRGEEDRAKGIPLTFNMNEEINGEINGEIKRGDGYSQIGKGLSLEFPTNVLMVLDASDKVLKDTKANFTVNGFDYTFNENGTLDVIVKGVFDTSIRIKKENIDKSSVQAIVYHASKNGIVVSINYVGRNKDKLTAVLVDKKV